MALALLPQEIIRQKRDGAILDNAAIAHFIDGITTGDVSEGQIAAFAMASLLNGMNRDETIALTIAMRDSGHVLAWPEIDRPILDKHSTGGVGDNVSLMLAPILAACGAAVPMISGRGLGHTGGTLDKMDAIPGYQSEPDEALFRQTVRDIGCAIIGQTADLAPADKRIYAVRDTTATVESTPLITASILSKKLAAGLHGLVLDVKFGNGAVMVALDQARALAQSLVSVANGAGLSTTALLTNMDEPLTDCAGNAVEVQSAVDFLTGVHQPLRLKQVVLTLAGALLAANKLAETPEVGMRQAEDVLDNGQACEKFSAMVHALGGPQDFVEKSKTYLPQANIILPLYAEEDGMIAAWDTRNIGITVLSMGGGRKRPEDRLDYSVGVTKILPIGTRVSRGDAVATVHAADQDQALKAQAMLQSCLTLGTKAPVLPPLIAETITAEAITE